MNPTLLKTLGFFVLGIALLFGVFTSNVKAQELNTVWERSTSDESLPDWFEPGFVRGFAYGTLDVNERIYVIDRDNNTIQILNPQTGDDVDAGTPFDLANVEGGLFLINDGDISDDGKLFVGNLTTDASVEEDPFKLYMWDSEGGDFTSSFTIATTEDHRLGDNFTVTGSVDDNTVEIWVPVQGSNPGIIYKITTDDQGSTWDFEQVALTGDDISIPANASVAFTAHGQDFYIAGNGSAPKRYTNDGEYVEDSLFDSILYTSARNSSDIFDMHEKLYLVSYAYNDDPEVGSNTNRTGRVYIYDITDPTAPERIAQSPLMGDDVDTFSSSQGGVYVSVNDAESTYTVIALDGVNGFAAYSGEIEADEPEGPLAGDYYIPQGDNDQGFESLGEAFEAYNELGLDGATTFFITDDLDETSNVLKLNRNDNSESASLRIAPAADTSPTITVAANNSADDENENVGLLILDSNWITIEGCEEITCSTNHLTISSGDENIGGNGLVSVYGASGNITIKNTNIVYTGDNDDAVGIRARRNNANTGGIVNLLIEGNSIGTEDVPFSDGLRLWGSDENRNNTSAVNNHIYASHRGITTFWNADNVFDGNTIWIVSPKEDVGFYAGIYLALTSGETIVTNNEFKNLAVNRTESASYAAGIVINSILGPHHITNNTFAAAAFENTGTAEGNSVYGIVLNNAAGDSENFIYHNSFRIGSSNETGTHAAFGVEGVEGTEQTWNFVNNLYTIENESDNSFAYSWPFEVDAFHSNYNNFDLSGTAGVATYGGGRFDDLVDWSPDSGTDENSTEVAVDYVSETDLRLTGSSIGDDNLAGTLLESVTTDIDGTARNEFAPYKGAFEGDVALTGDVQVGTFALIAPSDGFELNLQGDAEQEIEITWEEPIANEAVTYIWHADSVGGDFSEPLLSVPSDGDGSETTLTFTYETIDTILNAQGVEEGETAEFIWTVTAQADDVVRFADEPFELSITRNLSVSREISETPMEFSLSQNYPNPFNPTSTIEFTLPETADVVLEVYNINGQLVSTLVDSRMNSGQHSVVFDASNLASGVYLYRIRAGNYMETRQMTLIK